MHYPAGHLHKRELGKLLALESVERAILRMEAVEHEPDTWERACLMRALACLFSGAYELARAEAQNATIPPEERSPQAVLPSDAIAEFDLALIKRALQEARHLPVEPYPRLGATVLGPAHE